MNYNLFCMTEKQIEFIPDSSNDMATKKIFGTEAWTRR